MIRFFKHFARQINSLKTIIICVLSLNILSILSIYSSLHQGGELVDIHTLQKQIAWIIISWCVLIIFSLINYHVYFGLSYVLYTLNLLLLVGVHFFGEKAMGAQRWLSVSGITFQPSELSKIAIIIILARIFSQSRKHSFLKGFLFPFFLTAINAFLIFKQPDLGTALIILLMFFALGLCSRLNKLYFVALIIFSVVASPLALGHLKEYQKKRLAVFINPNADPLGSGYTIIQSKIAIGSGKAFGKGFLSGTQNQFNFLPERHTDFIFTVVAEEWGFFGSLFLLLLYWLLIKKIMQITRNFRDTFAYFLSIGIGLLFFLHVFINIGMTLGILPVVGLPLILLSYGGTNMLTIFVLLGILANIVRFHK